MCRRGESSGRINRNRKDFSTPFEHFHLLFAAVVLRPDSSGIRVRFARGNALAGLILFLHLMRDRIYLMGVMTEIGIFRQVHIMSDIAQVTVEALLNTGCGD